MAEEGTGSLKRTCGLMRSLTMEKVGGVKREGGRGGEGVDGRDTCDRRWWVGERGLWRHRSGRCG